MQALDPKLYTAEVSWQDAGSGHAARRLKHGEAVACFEGRLYFIALTRFHHSASPTMLSRSNFLIEGQAHPPNDLAYDQADPTQKGLVYNGRVAPKPVWGTVATEEASTKVEPVSVKREGDW